MQLVAVDEKKEEWGGGYIVAVRKVALPKM